jgi:hypothetical protein
MKKFFSVLLLLALCTSLSFAQGYSKGVHNLNVGIGFGLAGVYGDTDFPPISVGFGGATVGYNLVSVSEPSGFSGIGYSAEGSYALFGFHGGIRYLFSPNIGAFGEIGYGIGYITVGLNVRL